MEHGISALCGNSEAIRRSLPDVATDVMLLCQSMRSDASAIERVVTRDPFISAQLISLSNSAMFAPRTPIVGIKEAVVRIGLDAVRDLVMLVVTNSTMFRLPGFDKHLLGMRKRSMVTAMASRTIAKAMRVQTDYAFLAGLLHDIGHLLILEKCVNDGIVTATVMADAALAKVVLDKVEARHQEVGAAACRAWKLPPGVVDSAACHHHYKVEDKHYLAANLVAVGDLMTDHFGFGAVQTTFDPEHPVVKDLGLPPAQAKSCLDEVEKMIPSVTGGRA